MASGALVILGVFAAFAVVVVVLAVVLARRGSTGGGSTDRMRDAGRPPEAYRIDSAGIP